MGARLEMLFASRIIRFRSPLSRVRVVRLNPQLALLQPYPFERLRALFSGIAPNPQLPPISLSIGEPKHATPALVLRSACIGCKGPLKLSHNGWGARAARGDRCVAHPAAWPLGARRYDAGAARARQPRSPFLVRADGHRCEPRRCHRRGAESVLPDLRRRRSPRRSDALLRQQPCRESLRAAVGKRARGSVGVVRNFCTCARPTILRVE